MPLELSKEDIAMLRSQLHVENERDQFTRSFVIGFAASHDMDFNTYDAMQEELLTRIAKRGEILKICKKAYSLKCPQPRIPHPRPREPLTEKETEILYKEFYSRWE